MSLNYSLLKCKNWEELTNEENLPATNALVWSSMPLGFHEITEKNYREIYYRDRLYSAIIGESLMKSGKKGPEPRPITLEEIERRIGMETNASDLTRAEFFKRLRKHFDRAVDK